MTRFSTGWVNISSILKAAAGWPAGFLLTLTPVALRAPYVSVSKNKTNTTEGIGPTPLAKTSRPPEAKKEKAKNPIKTLD
jgi:hypothetical protein